MTKFGNIITQPYALDSEIKLKIKDTFDCYQIFEHGFTKEGSDTHNCFIDFTSEVDYGLDKSSKTMLCEPEISLVARPYALVLKVRENWVDGNKVSSTKKSSSKPHMLFLRGENLDGKFSEKLSQKSYRGLYYTNKYKAWRKAIGSREHKAFTVLKFPGKNIINYIIYPQFYSKITPFIDLYNILAENFPDAHAHLYIYLDKFFMKFSDEFDCSEMVEMSGIESDFFEGPTGISAYGYGLNQHLINRCVLLNDFIIRFLKDDQIAIVMDGVRNYSRKLLSNEGEEKFENYFGKIF